MSRCPPIRSESAPAIGATKIGIAVHGQDAQPGRERRVVLHRLEELREQEDRAEHPEEHQQRRDVREREACGCGRSASAASATRRAAPTRRTRPRAAAPATIGTTMPALVQPCALPRTSPQTIPSRPALASARPGRSSAESAPRVSSSRASASGASTSPIGTLSQKIQCHETPLTIAPPTSGPIAIASPPMPPQIAEREPAPLARHGRRRGSSASAASRSRRRRPARRARRRARSRVVASAAAAEAAVKSSEADREQPAAAEAVAERGAGEEQHGEGERVRVDRPLELRDRRVEVAPDHRQRRRDDEVVEADHEERDRGDRECPDRSIAFVCESSLPPMVKKRGSVLLARSPRAGPRPGLGLVVDLHRGEDVQQHPRARRSARPSASRRPETRCGRRRRGRRSRRARPRGSRGRRRRRTPASGPAATSGRSPAAPCRQCPMASSASSPRLPSAARWNISSVSRKQRPTVAT